MARLLEAFPDDLRIVYRDFPLMSIHDKAALATQAAEAAGLQGKYWEFHDLLFSQQDQWSSLSPEEFTNWLAEQAGEMGLDVEQFKSDMTSEEIVAKAQAAWDRGREIGMPGTPFLVFNGRGYQGPLSFSNLSSIVNLVLLEKKQFQSCPEMTIDPSKQYIATLKTEKGDIVIDLFADKAPLAVNNFIFLARQNWYDGVTFHRVLPNFVAQAGDPTGSGYGSPGYAFDIETSPDLKFDRPGLVAMANAGPGTNGSQFFITYAPVPDLDGGYTIFGEVVDGMDVVKQLTPRDPQTNPDQAPGDKILDVTIEEK